MLFHGEEGLIVTPFFKFGSNQVLISKVLSVYYLGFRYC